MKMDIELMIGILKVIESSETNRAIRSDHIEAGLKRILVNIPHGSLQKHVHLLNEEKYVYEYTGFPSAEFYVGQLTMKGHNFLAYMKSDEIKELIKENDFPHTLAFWEKASKDIMDKKLEKALKELAKEEEI